MAFVLWIGYHQTNNHILKQDFAAAVRTLPKSEYMCEVFMSWHNSP